MHVIKLADRVGIRVDAEHAAVLQRFLMPAPIKIEGARDAD
jgi:hypothetical protein